MTNRLAVVSALSELTFSTGMLNRFHLSLLIPSTGSGAGVVFKERFSSSFQI